jgi:AcrR family transcriptional regulator
VARRTGRRPGHPDTREAILAAARDAFAERGYGGASIRSIATGAGVDPALVHHYFGTKDDLFMAAVQPPIDPAEMLDKVFTGGDVNELGTRVVTAFLAVWDHPVNGPAFEALVRSAVSSELSGRLMREFFTAQIIRRVRHELRGDIAPAEIPLRATLVASQLFGLATIRYLLKFEPLASAPTPAVVATVAPNIQRYLTGDLGSLR